MAMDVYQPCPCGSGKKLKFCCQEIGGEMEKVLKLQQNNQNRAALQALNRLEKSHPGNAWVATTRASTLMGEEQFAEARDILHPLIESNPDHAYGLILYATAAFAADGYDASKAIIHRAFQRCIGTRPKMIGDLAFGIARWMHAYRRYMATRAHLALTMRLAQTEEMQEEVFVNLLDLDGDTEIPYPLRSVHPLAEYAPEDENRRTEAEKAERLCNIGCWGPAGRIYARLAEQDPDNPDLWQNVGLCRAWDGNERGAAEALHRSATLQDDHELAVECETMAQLLDQQTAPDRIPVSTKRYRVESVSQLLQRLGKNDRVRKITLPPPQNEDEVQPSGSFEILDRPLSDDVDPQAPTREGLPEVIGHLGIFEDLDSSLGPIAFLTAFEGDHLQRSRELFEEVAGEQVESVELPGDEREQPPRKAVPREFYGFYWRWAFPKRTPGVVRMRLEAEQWDHLLDEVWPETPLPALDGQSPSQAADDPDMKVRLTAALYVLDSLCERLRYSVDLDRLCERFNVAPLPPLPVTEDLSVSALSPLQLHRVQVAELNDNQLFHALNRALLIQHSRFQYDVLTEALRRPACTEKMDMEQAYGALVDLCQKRHRRDEALDWVARARDYVQTQDESFERSVQWALREMMIRLMDPDDPELKPLLSRIHERYLRKVPQLRDSVSQLIRLHGITPPWESGEVVTGTGGGLWTPSKPSEPQEGGKKLWIPGQD